MTKAVIDKNTWVKFDKKNEFSGTFTMAPLFPGMGTTIANSLRRVLLSSLPGAAITAVSIEGVKHEFAELEYAVEDVIDVLVNLKSVVIKSYSNEPKTIVFEHKGTGVITAGDIKTDSEVEILSKDQHIIEITKNVKFSMTLRVEQGVGYSPSENHKREDDDVNFLYLDASFSPVEKVSIDVQNTRVGRSLDYDAVELVVHTNGSLDVEEAVKQGTSLLIQYYSLCGELNKSPEPQQEFSRQEGAYDDKQSAALQLSVDDLELSARSLNCLKRARILKVSELVEMELSDLYKIKNFGVKSADEINEKLAHYRLSLKDSSENNEE